MSNGTVLDSESLDSEIQEQMIEQAKAADISVRRECTDEERIRCALTYGSHAVSNKILISISDNINKMAEAINDSEKQKQEEREGYVKFFKKLLIALVVITSILIFADTFTCYKVRIEFLVSVIVAILADIFAIVHTIVKYMTNVEHYNAYNKLIDSLLGHINCEHKDSDNQ